MDYESVAAIGSQLGSASVIVLDESVDMSWMLLKATRFFKHESCGKCTPCREGTKRMLEVLTRKSPVATACALIGRKRRGVNQASAGATASRATT